MVWTVVGLIALAAAGGLFYWRSRVLRDVALMASVPTSSARDAAAAPPGTLVEVKGVARCEAPLQAEYAGAPCVYHQTVQTEKYAVYETDAQGRQQRRERSRTLYANTRHVAFRVEDASGSVRVEPDGATFEAAEVFHETQGAGGLQGAINVGDVTIGVGGPLSQTWREHAVGLDAPVYVLGVVRPDGAIGAPPAGHPNGAFVISTKSEEQRSADQGGLAWWLMLWTIAAAAAGLAALLLPRLWR